MLTLNDRWSLFPLFLLCFLYISSSVLVNGAGDGGSKSGTESSSSSTRSASLAELFAKDPRKTLGDLLLAEEGGQETKLAELIRAEGIGEEEFNQLVEEMGDNERLIEKVFDDNKTKTIFAKCLEGIFAVRHSNVGITSPNSDGKNNTNKKAKRKEAKMRQTVDKKGQNAKCEKGEKGEDKAKANLQHMLLLLATAVDKIDGTEQLTDGGICFLGAVVVDGVVKGGGVVVNGVVKGGGVVVNGVVKRGGVVTNGVVKGGGVVVNGVAKGGGVVVNGVVKGSKAVANSVNSMLHKPEAFVSPEMINELPQRKVKEDQPSAESCAICSHNYKHGESVVTLPCAGEVKHEFHLKCTKIWFKQHKTCPLCHKEIDIPAKNGSESNASNAAEKGKVPSAPNAIPAV
ncbi:hypothetical protein niasHS_000031 [Heterodera schachtii]|uniref:RING-type domain-containing protein n=1 Tax=Heterodera schachtii TaxID=97005 RepID=A0ABD2KKP6_HETSC